MKRIYLMQRHAERQAALSRAQREKEAKERLRERACEAAAARAKAERQLQEALAEVPALSLNCVATSDNTRCLGTHADAHLPA